MAVYQSCLTIVFLMICTYTDLRYRKVYRKVLMIYFLLAAAGHLPGGPEELFRHLPGILPGLICLLASKITRQGIGYGDSLLILVSGISLGWRSCVWMVLTAFFWVGIWAMVLFCRRRDGKREIPFVPFLLAGMLLQSGGWM